MSLKFHVVGNVSVVLAGKLLQTLYQVVQEGFCRVYFMNTNLIVLSHLCILHPTFLLSLAYRIEVMFFFSLHVNPPRSFINFHKNTPEYARIF
jgi:hypothetical protein